MVVLLVVIGVCVVEMVDVCEFVTVVKSVVIDVVVLVSQPTIKIVMNKMTDKIINLLSFNIIKPFKTIICDIIIA
jgi:hypothetical protein